MSSKYSTLVGLSAAMLVVFMAVPGCTKAKAPKAGTTSAASTESSAAEPTDATTTTPPGKAETVLFDVTGSGTAETIDIVPAGPDRLYSVPLPWTHTITITPDVQQLQVVVVGTGEPNPGCKITLDGKVVAEQPEGGSAHCVFDRN